MNAAPLFAAGVLAAAALGGSVFMEFRGPITSLAVEARVLYALGGPTVKGASIHTEIATAALTGCWSGGPLFGCAVLDVGELRASAPDRLDVDVRAPWLVSLGTRVGIQWPLVRRFALRAFAEPRVTLSHPSILVDEVRVWGAPALSLVLGVGIAVLLNPGDS